MDLSVVVPTLNGRDQLAACLDALTANAPSTEVIVVNGPSADGTTGMVRDRDDVDVLIEISDRTVNVARNAGIEVATGEHVALVDYDNRVGSSWVEGVEDGLKSADVVTGPVNHELPAGHTTEEVEQRTIGGRDVTYFAGGNVAFRANVLKDLDGFDEYLNTGGARDTAHRLASAGYSVSWAPSMSVQKEPDTTSAMNGGTDTREWGWKYRALAYRLTKNYGVRPTVVRRIGTHAIRDSAAAARDVLRGDASPSRWVGNGADVLVGIAKGTSDGMVARARDRSQVRNPNGLSKRADRAVAKYDWRDGSEPKRTPTDA